MPKIVDHDRRRREVLDATWRVIGTDGLEAATVRRIAEEAGYSNGVLAHYFKNKNDILISAHELSFQRARDRIAAVTVERMGLDALQHAMYEALPLDDERFLEAQVDVSFLGQAVGDEYLRTIRSASYLSSRRLWGVFIEEAQTRDEVSPDDDAAYLVDEVLAWIDSLSMEAIINPNVMTVQRMVTIVDRFVVRISAAKND